MTALHSFRWALYLALAYLLLVLLVFAADAVGKAEDNVRELRRIVRGE